VRFRRSQISPREEFHGFHYLRHNQRRLEHLATLGLPLAGRSVLEVGAGIGDHTEFFLDRGCSVLTTDGRPENVEVLRERFPWIAVEFLDLDHPDPSFTYGAEVVYCYGTLYHLARPADALAFLAERCGNLLLLETAVSFGDELSVNIVAEQAFHPSQAVSGQGCRPTRQWVLERLRLYFPHVYLPKTQPWHPEFPLDWTAAPPPAGELSRAVFIASREALAHAGLTETLPERQIRH
jgi:hypothetical protein